MLIKLKTILLPFRVKYAYDENGLRHNKLTWRECFRKVCQDKCHDLVKHICLKSKQDCILNKTNLFAFCQIFFRYL